jgi:hypothetical protein
VNTLRLAGLTLVGLLLLAPAAAQAQSAPAHELGAVIDTRHSHARGPEVLAVTPGGAAQAMGLLPGDRVQSINGISLRDEGNLAARLDHALGVQGQTVRLDVLRDGEPLSFSGMLQPAAREPSRGCGYVSDRDPTPVVSDDIHAAEITSIDGDSTPLDPQNRHRLPAGEHVLVVSEKIGLQYFTRGQLRQRNLMQRRTLARAYKAIVVTVEPNMRYSIGAKLDRNTMDNDAMRANAYWEPVVFKERAQECR